MSNPDKAHDYLTVLRAADAWKRGEHIHARLLLDSLEDPAADGLHIVGLLLGALAGKGEGVSFRRVTRANLR